MQMGEEKVSLKVSLRLISASFFPFTGAVSRKQAPDSTLQWNKDIK